MGLSIGDALARLTAGADLEVDEAEAVLGLVLAGDATPAQIAAMIVALRMKGETVDEMTGLVRAMRGAGEGLPVDPAGLIDTCGTGGDRLGTVNVSTMAALVAAGAGARVCKHGNRAASSQCGSADVLEELGVAIALGPEGVASCIVQAGMGFCFAPRYHPAMRHVGPVRTELGVPTVFNVLGPLANPARVRRQVVGVGDAAMAERVLGVLAANGAEHAMVVHGDGGLDELSTTGPSDVLELRDGSVTRSVVDPAALGLERATISDLAGGNAADNARITREVLDGERGPVRDVVALNAAAALVVAGVVDALDAGLERATAAIDDGGAAMVLDRLVAVSQAAAPKA